MSLVIINLGGREDEGEGIIRMLKVLFSSKMRIEKKQKILEEEYGIRLSEEGKEDIKEMCNFSEGVEQRGIMIGQINTLTKYIKKIYKVDLREWLEGLTKEQLERAEDMILDHLSYEEFKERVGKQ